MPTVRSLHHPAPRLPVHTAEEWRFALLPNVRGDAPIADRRFTVAKRVAFVETAVVRSADSATLLHDHGIERGGQGPLVVQIRRAEDDAHRHAAAVRQDVALRAELRAVRWVRSREVPPFGAFTITESSAPHCH